MAREAGYIVFILLCIFHMVKTQLHVHDEHTIEHATAKPNLLPVTQEIVTILGASGPGYYDGDNFVQHVSSFVPWVGRGIPASEDSIRFGTLSDVHSDDLGNVYVADSANNAIVKISDAGKVVKVFTTRNCVPSTFTIDDKQNIFVPCSKYDAKVQRIDPEGRLHDFYKGEEKPSGIVYDRATGDIIFADNLQSRIVRIFAKGNKLLTNENLLQLALHTPLDVTSKGDVIVGEYTKLRVLKSDSNSLVDYPTNQLELFHPILSVAVNRSTNTIALTDGDDVWLVDGKGISSRLHSPNSIWNPTSVTWLPSGELVASDAHNNVLWRSRPYAGTVQFAAPGSMDFDRHGNLIVADNGIYVVTRAGRIIKRSPSQPDVLYTGVIASPTSDVIFATSSTHGIVDRFDNENVFTLVKDLQSPKGVVLDKNGNLIVAEEAAHVLRVIDANTGAEITVIGQKFSRGYQDGSFSTASFDSPRSIAWSPSGQLYVLEARCKMRIVDFERRYVETLSTDQALCSTAGTQMAVDRMGTLVVPDVGGNSITMYHPDYGLKTIVQGGDDCTTKDGDIKTATICHSGSVAIGPGGELFVSDWHTARIRTITHHANLLRL